MNPSKSNGAFGQVLTSEHPSEIVHLTGTLAERGERIRLRPQQRLARSMISNGMLAVSEGVLAIDVVPNKCERQILDFLMPGDIIPPCAYLAPHEVSIRAVTIASLIRPDGEATTPTDAMQQFWEHLFEQAQSQLARSDIHQLVIGHLDAESRVASFLLTLALRSNGAFLSGMLLALPMSRHDIADYLAINPDTLSRVMMRFETLGLIERINRHAIRIADIGKLGLLTPLLGIIRLLERHAGPNARAA